MIADFTINALQSEALEFLDSNLKKIYTYHNAAHTLEVCNAIVEFAAAADLAPELYTVLRIAAVFHDFGYLQTAENNENLSLQYMQEFAPRWQLPEELIMQAHELIMETVYPYKPHSRGGELLCDADIEYIGRECFIQKALSFRQELQGHGNTFSERQWWELELEFLRQNSFFSPECRRLRSAMRQKNITAVENILLQLKG